MCRSSFLAASDGLSNSNSSLADGNSSAICEWNQTAWHTGSAPLLYLWHNSPVYSFSIASASFIIILQSLLDQCRSDGLSVLKVTIALTSADNQLTFACFIISWSKFSCFKTVIFGLIKLVCTSFLFQNCYYQQSDCRQSGSPTVSAPVDALRTGYPRIPWRDAICKNLAPYSGRPCTMAFFAMAIGEYPTIQSNPRREYEAHRRFQIHHTSFHGRCIILAGVILIIKLSLSSLPISGLVWHQGHNAIISPFHPLSYVVHMSGRLATASDKMRTQEYRRHLHTANAHWHSYQWATTDKESVCTARCCRILWLIWFENSFNIP